jgi:hypothetical protein
MLPVVLMQKVGRRGVYYLSKWKSGCCEFFLVFKNYQGDSGSQIIPETRDQKDEYRRICKYSRGLAVWLGYYAILR